MLSNRLILIIDFDLFWKKNWKCLLNYQMVLFPIKVNHNFSLNTYISLSTFCVKILLMGWNKGALL